MLSPADILDASILIVDDQEAMAALIRRVLQRAGLPCVTANTVPSALQIVLAGGALDAVVLDVLMADVDGLAAIRHLREVGYEGKIVMCTAIESAAVRATAMAHGADGFVLKSDGLRMLPVVLASLGVVPRG